MARVLLIDDDRDQLEVRRLIFEHRGHAVAIAMGSAEAGRVFESHNSDCIVMDLRLPKAEDGLALIRAFHGSPSFAARILVLSGYPADIRGTPEESLVEAVLTKPARSSELLERVERCFKPPFESL